MFSYHAASVCYTTLRREDAVTTASFIVNPAAPGCYKLIRATDAVTV